MAWEKNLFVSEIQTVLVSIFRAEGDDGFSRAFHVAGMAPMTIPAESLCVAFHEPSFPPNDEGQLWFLKSELHGENVPWISWMGVMATTFRFPDRSPGVGAGVRISGLSAERTTGGW